MNPISKTFKAVSGEIAVCLQKVTVKQVEECIREIQKARQILVINIFNTGGE